MTKEEIIVRIKDVLNKTFSVPQKCIVKETYDTLRFACPLCHDSIKEVWKKRGNFYLSSGNFHCFNCGEHMNAIKFFRKFNADLSIEESNYFYKLIAQGAVQTLKSNVELSEILKYSIDFKKFIAKFGIKLCSKQHPFIVDRCLAHKIGTIGYKNNDVYIFNLVGDKLLGFQIKENYGTKYERYNKIPMSEMYRSYIKTDKVDPVELQKYDKLSLLYGLFLLNFNEPVTVFEGALNSYFMANSIATSTAHSKLDILENIPNKRFLYDNDDTGLKKMIKLLKSGNSVFLWSKFIKNEGIIETEEWVKYRKERKKGRDINDMNDVIMYAKINNKTSIIKNMSNYFSSSMIDSVYL